jgi:D-lactate dehydrogenase (cytochrome)
MQVLLKLGLRVILPPPFLCCGYPAIVNARQEAHSRIVLRNMIVFSQIREMFSYLDFERCIVTCGTCREALGDLDAGKIFGCEVTDLARFTFDKGMRVEGKKSCLYHAPCHDSLDGKAAEIFQTIGGYQLNRVPHCCSEAGTMAMSRPDISSAMLQRKTSSLSQVVGEMALDEPLLLTNCPGCLMGLGRQRLSLNVRHTAEELATALCGEVWIDELQLAASRAERVRF